ncbi:MAG: hypothetical protein RMJ43_06875 [Chloroherpetonaceae bacterium]|nr:hypothetical protein [Chloroherpetonaceae bacterium]
MARPLNAERMLQMVLRFAGIMMLLALPTLFLPFETMNAVNRYLTGEPLPPARTLLYLTRSVSLLYASQGAITLFLSAHVQRYLPLLRFQAWVALCFGGSMLALDLWIGMPPLWLWIEGPWLLLLSLIVLYLTGTLMRKETRL